MTKNVISVEHLTKQYDLGLISMGMLNHGFNYFDSKNPPDDLIQDKSYGSKYFPCIVPNWDNTPRSGIDGK